MTETTLQLWTGVALGMRWFGPEDGERAIALHGWLDNADTWAPLMAAATPLALRVAALDLPGHGLSGQRARGHAYHMVDFVADVVAAMDALGWERCALLGHSMGGHVAGVVAATYPERVSRLVLVDSLGFMPPVADQAAERLRRAIDKHRDYERAGAARLRVFPSVAVAAQRKAQGDVVGTLPLEAAQVMTPRSCRAASPREAEAAGVAPGDAVVWRSDPRLMHPSRGGIDEPSALALLASIRCPVLLILPRDGLFAVSRGAGRLGRVRALANAPLTIVAPPSGGHHVHIARAELCASVLAAWLQGDAAAHHADLVVSVEQALALLSRDAALFGLGFLVAAGAAVVAARLRSAR